ncbi:MAG: RIP metalloprotease RseP [Campylobacteraceae bacterium]|jgi:regulator of sigma E protease|nr:RIP metalloprotease RseP [Campylobacteraceae bacterium]
MFGASFGHFGIVYALLALSFLIFFHEFGHFIAARIFKVKVEVFSIGFGKKVVSKKFGDTTYCLSMIPLGGYVQMKGQNDIDPTQTSDDEDSYNKKAPWKRIIILFAGPFANFVLAFLLYLIIANLGVPSFAAQIGGFSNNSVAQAAGLQINDTIKEINGVNIKIWDDVKKAIQKSEGEIDISAQREDKLFQTKLTPLLGENQNIFKEKVYEKLIGITPSGKVFDAHYGGVESISYAKDELLSASLMIFKSLQKLITGVVSPKELGGIIAIVDITSSAAKAGIVAFFMLTALISVNLGVLNLLPIPALDGGHIMFNIYEALFRRSPNEKVFYYMTVGGWAILMSLVLFTVYNDIARLLTH